MSHISDYIMDAHTVRTFITSVPSNDNVGDLRFHKDPSLTELVNIVYREAEIARSILGSSTSIEEGRKAYINYLDTKDTLDKLIELGGIV